MANNVSGNYEITNREIDVVKTLFDFYNVKYKSITKHKNANDGDILVVLPDDSSVVIEVKEEFESRFLRFGDLGIDLVSCFQFKKDVNPNDWKGVKHGSETIKFFKDIDKTNRFYKPGKVSYSKSDLWLFFSADKNGQIFYHSFFPGSFMTSDKFKSYLMRFCNFSVNNKPADQMSHNDNHLSAVFYINHKDPYLTANAFDITKLSKKDPNGFSGGGFGME